MHKDICKACFNDENGVKTRISVPHTCTKAFVERLIKVCKEKDEKKDEERPN